MPAHTCHLVCVGDDPLPDISVRPALPRDLSVDQISSETARVMWTLTNSTADEGADSLALLVTYSNGSLVREITMPGDQRSVHLQELVPASDYVVMLRAENVDGVKATNPVSFRTLHGNPRIASIAMVRVNGTAFLLTLTLAYTGGGNVSSLSVAYRSTSAGSGAVGRLEVVEPTMTGLQLREVLVLSEETHGVMELEFTVSVINQFLFPSNEVTQIGECQGHKYRGQGQTGGYDS